MQLGIVVKVSKLCNLRCRYCCETEELDNPLRMSISQIRTIFRRVREVLDFVETNETHNVTFYWHGGEPFAQPIDYWWSILEAQSDEFWDYGARITLLNSVQSNLTLTKKAHLPLLRHLRLGFSFDVVNDHRVRKSGRPSDDRVIASLDMLAEEGILPAGITVVSRGNVQFPNLIAQFFVHRQLPFRFIHLDEALEHIPSVTALKVSFKEYINFAAKIYEDTMVRAALNDGLRIDPISDAVSQLEQLRAGEKCSLSLDQAANQEYLLEIDTTGNVYSPADYPYRNSYGNIFDVSIIDLLASEGRRQRVARSSDKIGRICVDCELFGHGCTGIPVGHATEGHYAEILKSNGCIRQKISRMIASADSNTLETTSLNM